MTVLFTFNRHHRSIIIIIQTCTFSEDNLRPGGPRLESFFESSYLGNLSIHASSQFANLQPYFTTFCESLLAPFSDAFFVHYFDSPSWRELRHRVLKLPFVVLLPVRRTLQYNNYFKI